MRYDENCGKSMLANNWLQRLNLRTLTSIVRNISLYPWPTVQLSWPPRNIHYGLLVASDHRPHPLQHLNNNDAILTLKKKKNHYQQWNTIAKSRNVTADFIAFDVGLRSVCNWISESAANDIFKSQSGNEKVPLQVERLSASFLATIILGSYALNTRHSCSTIHKYTFSSSPSL